MDTIEYSVTIQIHKFKNIELFKQGMYQIRLRIIYDYNSITRFAQPFQLLLTTEKPSEKSCVNIIPAHILDDFSCFNTRIMLVRYQEEVVSLHEGCEFRFSVPVSQLFNLKILADLYFTNLESSPKEKNTFRKLDETPVMTCVVSKEFLIKNPLNPESSYLPLSFDPKFFCIADSVVHLYAFEYNFRPSTNFFEDFKEVGGSRVDKTYSHIISPLYLAYNQARLTCNELITLNSSNEIDPIPELILPLRSVDSTSFHESLKTHNSLLISESILEELESLSVHLANSLSVLQTLTFLNNFKSVPHFKQKFSQEAWHHFQEFINLSESNTEISYIYEKSTKDSEIRKEDYYRNLEGLHIQADDLFNQIEKHPIFMFNSELSHFKQVTEGSFTRTMDIHVVFLVHGYRGSSLDMHMIKGYLNIIYPLTYVYSCRANENFTDCNIENLGQNLAQEVSHYLSESKVPKYKLRISFIGHSLGGLIIRSALKYLPEYKSCMFSYISLSSPHTGIFFSQNFVFQFGKWALKKLQDSTSFLQMMMKDSKNKRESFIYKLSLDEGLSWFSHVLFFTCSDDPYVSVDSAGSYIPPKSVGSKHEELFREIVGNLLEKIGSDRLIRVDVSFKYSEVMDWFLLFGNRHIDFLDDPCFLKMMFYSMPKLFS